MEKNTKSSANPVVVAISQGATSRVQPRNAEFSQANASTAKIAPVTSWKSARNDIHSRRKPVLFRDDEVAPMYTN